jgi:hypothetical protein
MAKQHSSRNITRETKNSRRIQPVKFILYVEGRNTEPSYFRQLKKANCKVEPVSIKGKGIGCCINFVEEANVKFHNLSKSKQSEYTERWLVFDCDGHEDFAPAIKRARELGFSVAFSNMCIEYWFLLHFENHDGNPIPMVGNSHSQSQINIINKYISRYNSTSKCKVPLYDKDSKDVNDDFFDLMMAVDPQNHKRRIVNALERAKLIHDRRKKNGEEFKESVTTMYELLLRLGVFDYDEKTQSYTLFERQ